MILVIIGAKGSGKTSLGKQFVNYNKFYYDDLNLEELTRLRNTVYRNCGAGETTMLVLDASLSRAELRECIKVLTAWRENLPVFVLEIKGENDLMRVLHGG